MAMGSRLRYLDDDEFLEPGAGVVVELPGGIDERLVATGAV